VHECGLDRVDYPGLAIWYRQGLREHAAVQRLERDPPHDRALPTGSGRRCVRPDDQRESAVSRGADRALV